MAGVMEKVRSCIFSVLGCVLVLGNFFLRGCMCPLQLLFMCSFLRVLRRRPALTHVCLSCTQASLMITCACYATTDYFYVCFCTVVPDGYGLSYAIGNDHIRWTITSLKRSTAELKHYLAEAASETRAMMERAEKQHKNESKL